MSEHNRLCVETSESDVYRQWDSTRRGGEIGMIGTSIYYVQSLLRFLFSDVRVRFLPVPQSDCMLYLCQELSVVLTDVFSIF